MPQAWSPDGRKYLHLGLLHDLDNLQLALGNLNDLLNEARANLLLKFVDPA